MENLHILTFAFDEIRVISETELENILKEVSKKGKELTISLWAIEGYDYWVYLLNTLNANKENCKVDNTNNKVKMKKVFDLFYLQLSSMNVDDQQCFEQVEFKGEDKIAIKCSDYLYELISKKKNYFSIMDELRGLHRVLHIF